jgi:hypothetical protein
VCEWNEKEATFSICCSCGKAGQCMWVTIPPLRGFMPYCEDCLRMEIRLDNESGHD